MMMVTFIRCQRVATGSPRSAQPAVTRRTAASSRGNTPCSHRAYGCRWSSSHATTCSSEMEEGRKVRPSWEIPSDLAESILGSKNAGLPERTAQSAIVIPMPNPLSCWRDLLTPILSLLRFVFHLRNWNFLNFQKKKFQRRKGECCKSTSTCKHPAGGGLCRRGWR